jgi:hypothetical protein
MEQIHTGLQAAAQQDANGFRDAIHDALAAKIENALELKKIEIASKMFSAHQEEELGVDQEIESDENV